LTERPVEPYHRPIQRKEGGNGMADKAYYCISEISRLLNKKRDTIKRRIEILRITTHTFPPKSGIYVSKQDVENIQKVLEHPWLVDELRAPDFSRV
jgi:hypothetical protein